MSEWKDKLERGDVVLVDFNMGAFGNEKRGVRPAVVLSNTLMNRESPNILLAPMTNANNKQDRNTGRYRLLPTQVYLSNLYYDYLDKASILQLEDMRSSDKTRILRRLGELSKESMADVENKLKGMFLIHLDSNDSTGHK